MIHMLHHPESLFDNVCDQVKCTVGTNTSTSNVGTYYLCHFLVHHPSMSYFPLLYNKAFTLFRLYLISMP